MIRVGGKPLAVAGPLFFLLACSSSTHDPRAPRPVDRVAPPPPTEHTLGQPPVEGRRVVFAVVAGDLVPLACTEGPDQEVRRGAVCLEMVPEGSEVAVDVEHQPDDCGPRVREVARVTGPTETLCIDEGVPSLAVDRAPPSPQCTAYGFALWPAEAMDDAARIAYMEEGSPGALLPPQLASALEESVRDVGTPILHQYFTADAGTDGASLHILSAYVPHGEADPAYPDHPRVDPDTGEMRGPFLRSGLFVAESTTASLRMVERSEWERYEVLATVDIDDDGQAELLVRSFYYEGSAMILMRLSPEGRIQLGLYGCGA